MRVRLRKNILDRWIVVYGEDNRVDGFAWSGSRFVSIDKDGLPDGGVQVSNLGTREEAAEYAATFGFEVVG